MPKLIDIVWFLLVSLVGFFCVGIAFFIAQFTGSLPEITPEGGPGFIVWFLGGMMWAWVFGSLIGLAYLFVKTRLRLVFLWAPVYFPVLYAPAVLAYFG